MPSVFACLLHDWGDLVMLGVYALACLGAAVIVVGLLNVLTAP